MDALELWQRTMGERDSFTPCVLAALERAGVEFCLIRGAGLSAILEPCMDRYVDIDIAPADVGRAVEAVTSCGRVDRRGPDAVVQSDASGIVFRLSSSPASNELIARAVEGRFLGIPVRAAGIEDLTAEFVSVTIAPRTPGVARHLALSQLAVLVEAFPALSDLLPVEVRDRTAL